MKNLLFTCISIVFIFFYNSISYSQGLGPNITSPQVYDFIRYGNIPVSHYTGGLNLSVPIYHYSDNDFNVNVDLRYSSSGFKPSKRPNFVGLDWFLNVGGSITRAISGIPDDVENYTPTGIGGQSPYSGFSHLAIQHPFADNSLYGHSADILYTHDLVINYNNKHYELRPDIFYFNFMGYSGKFFYGFDGEIHVVADGDFKVDMSNFSTQSLNSWTEEFQLNDSEIIITDARGYIYTFGGDKKYLEYSVNLNIYLTPDENYAYSPKILSWSLKKVKAPNGREIIFEYKDFEESIDEFSVDTYHYLFNVKDYLSYNITDYGNGNDPIMEEYRGRNYSAIKTSYLESIIINNTTINFSYIENSTTFYDSGDFGMTDDDIKYNQKNLRLDEITVKYDGQTIKKYNFTYQDVGRRFFLTEVEEENNNPYIFTYSQTNNLPNPLVSNIDYWGYWNGGNNISIGGVRFPQFNFSSTGDIVYISNEREPNSFSNRAMLSSVTYPTKGYSNIEYELHTYSKRLENKSDNNFFPKLYDVSNLIAGGVRVSRITDYDNNGNSTTREFKYLQNAMANTSVSSGVLNYWPRYIFKRHYRTQGSSGWLSGFVYYNISQIDFDYWIISGDNTGYYNLNDNYITYSEVAEVLNDGSSKVYKFNTYETNPDVSLVSNSNLDQILPLPDNLSATMSTLVLDDTSIERGKIKSIDLYKDAHTKVQNTTYHYNEDTNRFNSNISTYLLGVDIWYLQRIFTYQNNLEKKIVTTYNKDGLNPIVTEEEYQYDLETNLLKKSSFTNSNNQEYSTYYKYPTDYNFQQNYSLTGFSAILKSMVDKNILYPIEIKSTLKDNSEKVISASLVEYKNEQGNIVKNKEFKLKGLQSTFQDSYLQENYPYLNFTKMNEYYESIIYHHYDPYGNPIEVSKTDGTHIYYIYGYQHSKPIAKIVNFTQAQAQNIQSLIDAAVTASDNDIDAASEDALRTALNNLRQALPDNTQVTTYTYDPLIGVTSITDPKGDTQYYEYDALQRLKYIKDKNGHILKEYEYHYRE